jgi:hypothetical protein
MAFLDIVMWPTAIIELSLQHCEDAGKGITKLRGNPARVNSTAYGPSSPGDGEVVLRAAAGNHSRGGHRRCRGSEGRGQPCQPGEVAGRSSRTTAARSWPGRTSACRFLRDDDATADRYYIKEFLLARNRELGRKYGVEYAEAFQYIWPGTSGVVKDYVRKHGAVKVGLEHPQRYGAGTDRSLSGFCPGTGA